MHHLSSKSILIQLLKYFIKLLTSVSLLIVIFSQTSFAQQKLDAEKITRLLNDPAIANKDSLINKIQAQLQEEFKDSQRITNLLDSVDLKLKNKQLLLGYNKLLKGYIYKDLNSARALTVINNGLSLIKDLNDTTLYFQLSSLKGYIYKSEYDNENAINTYFNLLKYLKGSKNYYRIGTIYAEIGTLQYKGNAISLNGDFSEGIINLKQAIFYLIKYKGGQNDFNLLNTTNTLALSFSAGKKYDSALFYFDKAIKIANNNNMPFWIALINGNKARIYINRNQFDTALYFLDADFKASLKIKKWSSASSALLMQSSCYIKTDKLALAKLALQKSDSIIDLYGSNPMQKKMSYSMYQALYEAQSNWKKAYFYQKKVITLSDSISKLYKKNELNRTQSKYILENQTKNNELLEKENSLLEKEIKLKNTIFILGILAGVLIIVLAYTFYYQYKLKHKLSTELTRKNKQITFHKKELEYKVEARTKELKTINDELDSYLYHSSHDIRSPIATILGLVEVGKLDLSKHELKKILKKIEQSAFKMDVMLKKMQDLHYLDKFESKNNEMNVSVLLNALTSKYNEDIQNLRCVIETDIEENLYITTTPNLLEMALSNIIENALTFGKPTSNTPFILKFSYFRKGDNVIFRFRDYGEGISQHYLNKIFELYFRGSSKSKGNGLGLFIAKKAIKKLGGNIRVESELNKGSLFEVSVPS